MAGIDERRHQGLVQAGERGVEIERAGEQAAGLGQQRRSSHRLFGDLPGRLLAGQLNAMGRLLADRFRFLVKIDKHADLRPQHVRVDRRGDEIHRSERVALGDMRIIVERGDENDRRVLGPLPLANQRGRLEAIHLRHVDVEQDHGEIVLQQTAQRLAAGKCLDDILPQLAREWSRSPSSFQACRRQRVC